MNRSLRAACALLACVGGFATGASAASAKTLDIVIAGDSYSSGVGASGSSGTCIRSPRTWGQVYAALAREKGLTVNVNNQACGGAVVANLYSQINAVTPSTDLVVLTIGGNDVGFANIVVQCFAPLISDPSRCKSAIDQGKAKVPGVQTAALAALQTLKTKLRPGGKVVVASYPYLANPGHYILRGLTSSYDTGAGARQLGDLGDQAVINAANQANAEAGYDLVTFVPTKDRFIGHEPNQDPWATNPNRWINEFDFNGPYHPNDEGYRQIGAAVFAASGPTYDFGVSQ